VCRRVLVRWLKRQAAREAEAAGGHQRVHCAYKICGRLLQVCLLCVSFFYTLRIRDLCRLLQESLYHYPYPYPYPYCLLQESLYLRKASAWSLWARSTTAVQVYALLLPSPYPLLLPSPLPPTDPPRWCKARCSCRH
jgi:hypothetical protein